MTAAALWRPDMTDAEYFALDAVSNSRLTDLARSPAYCKWRMGAPHDATDATRLGDATHVAILTPHLFDARFVQAPVCDRRTKAGKEAYAAVEAAAAEVGSIVLPSDDFDLCMRMSEAVWAHPEARELLKACNVFEVPGTWTDPATGMPCKIKPDARGPGLIADLKTTRCASKHAFTRSVVAYGYHRQDALYSEGHEAIEGDTPDFAFLVVEKAAPVEVVVYRLDQAAKEAGRSQVGSLRHRYAACVRDNRWPGLESGLLSLPPWALNESPEPADVSGTFEEMPL